MTNLRFASSLLLSAMVVCPSNANGQTGTLTGLVTDGETGEPIAGVAIVLDGTKLSASSDAGGRYVLVKIPVGTYAVRVVFQGFIESVLGVRIHSDRESQLDFALVEDRELRSKLTDEMALRRNA